MIAARLIKHLFLCLFAVLFTAWALGWVDWQLLLDAGRWLIFKFNYGWKAKMEKTKWL
jgi:hypothetical protein